MVGRRSFLLGKVAFFRGEVKLRGEGHVLLKGTCMVGSNDSFPF